MEIDEASSEKDPVQFTREADHFSECVLNNKVPKSSGEEGLRDMKYIEQIYAAAGVRLQVGMSERKGKDNSRSPIRLRSGQALRE